MSKALVALALWPLSAQAAPTQPVEFLGKCRPAPIIYDTFERATLGPNWIAMTRPYSAANANRELQAYTSANVALSGHGLSLRAEHPDAGSYTSARVYSAMAFRYGCFEFEAKLPAGKGLWPALWLRSDYNKPANGEIDAMEGWGSRPDAFQATIHYWRDGAHLGSLCLRTGGLGDSVFALKGSCRWKPVIASPDYSAAYHRYGLIWTPTSITWLLDGQPLFDTSAQVPSFPMFIHMNLAVGGVFDGDPDGSTPFPAALQLRAVRVWPLRGG